jgi:hypothetical protein
VISRDTVPLKFEFLANLNFPSELLYGMNKETGRLF